MENTLKKDPTFLNGLGSSLIRGLSRFKTIPAQPGLKTLKTAIAQKQITPVYQPFINAQTGKIAGIEVLARWRHPIYGYVSPDLFIPLAEKNGLIVSLTHLLIQQVIADLEHPIQHFPVGTYICINISAQNCLDPNFEIDIRVNVGEMNE